MVAMDCLIAIAEQDERYASERYGDQRSEGGAKIGFPIVGCLVVRHRDLRLSALCCQCLHRIEVPARVGNEAQPSPSADARWAPCEPEAIGISRFPWFHRDSPAPRSGEIIATCQAWRGDGELGPQRKCAPRDRKRAEEPKRDYQKHRYHCRARRRLRPLSFGGPLVGSQNLIKLGDRTRYPFDADGGRINPSRANILADTKLAGLQRAKLFLET
jgi:hypothetical protein